MSPMKSIITKALHLRKGVGAGSREAAQGVQGGEAQDHLVRKDVREDAMMKREFLEIAQETPRCFFPKFPSTILYSIQSGTIRVLAFAHLHRMPGYWAARAKT